MPSPARANLLRLFAAVDRLEATPNGFGHWERRGGRRRWIAAPASREARRAWRPSADDPTTYDHLLRTRLGNLDVVPELTGRYAPLRRRAVVVRIGGVRVAVASRADLLRSLRRAGRAKDRDRVERLRALPPARRRSA